eukprot:922133-Prorocentrum_minimum.AAC.2
MPPELPTKAQVANFQLRSVSGSSGTISCVKSRVAEILRPSSALDLIDVVHWPAAFRNICWLVTSASGGPFVSSVYGPATRNLSWGSDHPSDCSCTVRAPRRAGAYPSLAPRRERPPKVLCPDLTYDLSKGCLA